MTTPLVYAYGDIFVEGVYCKHFTLQTISTDESICLFGEIVINVRVLLRTR